MRKSNPARDWQNEIYAERRENFRTGLRVWSGFTWIIAGIYFLFIKYEFPSFYLVLPAYFIIGTGIASFILGEIQYVLQRTLIRACEIISEHPSPLGGKIMSCISFTLVIVGTILIFPVADWFVSFFR